MKTTIPHRKARGMCPVNGIRDLIHWRAGRDWSNEFVYGLGLGGGFAYLRFKSADPPRQVYWGNAGPRQQKYLAELLGAGYSEVENRSFAFAWGKAREAVDAGTPPVIGPLDMYHLPFYQALYHRRHIPIHYVLLIGHDDGNAHVLDTDHDGVQAIPLADLEPAWNVDVPGLGKKNRLAILDVPAKIAPTGELVTRSLAEECRAMLEPPVSMVGIPAMEKIAREIAGWPRELGEKTAGACLRQVREYLNSPPDLEGDHLTAGRDLYVAFLEEAAAATGLDLSAAIGRLRGAMGVIPDLAGALGEKRLKDAAACFARIAADEREAYAALGELVQEFH
ncbi:MAG: DUF4872 domain-containing protein [Candidatus Krumholzibacteriota bacterium]|nr:DUF4872 domain-containing protein [Candidatus Krumholzibacteriota bacterium]